MVFSSCCSRILIFFNSHSGGWSRNGSTRHVGHWMAYYTCPGWLWRWRNWWNEDWQGKPKYSKKTCPSATLSTTNPTWADPGSNPGRRGGKPATNCLSYGAASPAYYIWTYGAPTLTGRHLVSFRMADVNVNEYGMNCYSYKPIWWHPLKPKWSIRTLYLLYLWTNLKLALFYVVLTRFDTRASKIRTG
jgi:hypothetical protein